MGYQDRWYNREDSGGGVRGWFRRTFSTSASFFDWALPLGRVPLAVPGIGGILVRVHLFYIVYIAGELIMASTRGLQDLGLSAARMGTLFLLVLLHEFGHCFACRRVGGDADDILMWPLGGLAACRPPHNWKAHLITTLAGPGVNAVLFPVFGLALWLTGAGWPVIAWNPFSSDSGALWAYFDGRIWRYILWSAHSMNMMLLLFNMLVPMFPMDCGRVVQELLWGRIGYARSMLIASTLGLVVAVILGMFGLWTRNNNMVGIAVFGGFTCFQTRRQFQQHLEANPWSQDFDPGEDSPGRPTWRQQRAERAALKKQQAERATQAEVDRILAKISEQGMQSLTSKEKRTLEDATKRSKNP